MKRFTDEQIQLITEMIDWNDFNCHTMCNEFKINSDMLLMFWMNNATCKIELWEWCDELVGNEDWAVMGEVVVVFTGDFEDDMIGGVWKLLESIERD